MKIAIYGGSFNPIHKGHLKIAKKTIEELKLDKLIFIPAFKNPFKSKEKYAESNHRINMINLVKEEKMEISLFEIKRKGLSYTIDTVKYFKSKYPKDELYLIIGSDNVSKLNKWEGIDDISKMSKIVVFKREGAFSKINIKKYNCHLIKNDLYNCSSSLFKKGNFQLIDKKVNEYIAKEFLYVPELLLNMVNAKRHKHCMATGSLAVEYAKKIGFDSKKAWFAGVMHDITKNMNNEWHKNFLLENDVNEINLVEDYQFHSLTAYYWLKNHYLLKDEEILNSIKVHTNLGLNLNKIDKIVYAADKLCEGRKFEGIQKIRKLILDDFDKGFKEIVKINYQKLINKNIKLSKKQKDIYERII